VHQIPHPVYSTQRKPILRKIKCCTLPDNRTTNDKTNSISFIDKENNRNDETGINLGMIRRALPLYS